MLKARVLTALVLVPLVLGAILWLDTPLLAVLIGIPFVAGAWEWSRLSGFASLGSRIIYTGLTIFAMWYCYGWLSQPVILRDLFYLFFVLWMFALFWLAVTPVEEMLSNVTGSYLQAVIGGGLLIPSWLAMLGLHIKGGHGAHLLIAFLTIIWAADSGAYFVGKFMGVTRLAPVISPGKTLEGVYGGIILAVIMAYIMSISLGFSGVEHFQFIAVAMLGAVFSIVGDLFESVSKRSAGIKDSGRFFPGHGGAMDRIDGLTAAAPVYFLGLSWFPALLIG